MMDLFWQRVKVSLANCKQPQIGVCAWTFGFEFLLLLFPPQPQQIFKEKNCYYIYVVLTSRFTQVPFDIFLASYDFYKHKGWRRCNKTSVGNQAALMLMKESKVALHLVEWFSAAFTNVISIEVNNILRR